MAGLWRLTSAAAASLVVSLALTGLLAVDAHAQTRKFSAKTKFLAYVNSKPTLFDSAAAACNAYLTAARYVENNSSSQSTTYSCTVSLGYDANNNPILAPSSYTYTQQQVTTVGGAVIGAGPQWMCTGTYTNTLTVSGGCVTGSVTSNTTQLAIGNIVQEVRVCPPNWSWWDQRTCYSSTAPVPTRASDDCKVGNPIAVGSGCKQESVELYVLRTSSRSVPISLHYNSQPVHGGGRLAGEKNWMLDPFDRRVILNDLASLGRVYVVRRSGYSEGFEQLAAGVFKSFDNQVTLAQISASEWRRTDFSERTIETYNSTGALISLRYFEGGGFDLQYGSNPNRPTAIVSTVGHRVDLQYGAQLSTVLLPDNKSVTLGYTPLASPTGNSEMLTSVVFQDGTSRRFAYGQAYATSYTPADVLTYQGAAPGSGTSDMSLPELVAFGRPVHELRSVTDETNTVLSEFNYDNQGRTTQTQRAGGVERHQVSYPNAARSSVLFPLGASVDFVYLTNNEQQRLSAIERRDNPSDPNTPVYTQLLTYDPAGNVTGRSDSANKGRRCSAFDAPIGLEAIRIEGIASGGCPGDLAAYVPGAGTAERKLQWRYDTTRRLPTAMAEPFKITTFVYHGVPDPTAGNAIASCVAAGAPNLPNGWAPAPLCKRVEQATTDANGASGFGATVSGTARTWAFAYNADGQLLSANGPRTDATDVTSYVYYTAGDTAPTPKYRRGDLQTMTTAAGHATQYTDYDRNRRPTRIVDPNGVVTTFVYHDRGWLLSATTSDGSSSRPVRVEYWPHGKVKKVSQPDGSFMQMGYDAAQRLISVTDNLGNSVSYTLDNAGNRTDEQFKDASNTLRQRVTRMYSAINLLQSVTGALQ